MFPRFQRRTPPAPDESIVRTTVRISNLLVPGAATYTHVAFRTYRLESTWMMGGHAAGVAATLPAQQAKSVQSIDLPALREKLCAQKQVIDFPPGQPEKFPVGKEKEF